MKGEHIYKQFSEQLEALADSESKYHYFNKGKRFLLVDKDANIEHPVKLHYKKLYLEVSVRKNVQGRAVEQSIGRYLLGLTDKSLIVDHINGNTLDNRKSNLRAVSVRVNTLNKHKYKSKNNYKGVFKKPWGFQVEVHGYYTTYILKLKNVEEMDAVKIYDKLALKTNGTVHNTNFDRGLYSESEVNMTYEMYKDSISTRVRDHQRPENLKRNKPI